MAGSMREDTGSDTFPAENEIEFANVSGGLLAELDAQQDDVIRRLDRLNHRIEQLMRDWSRAASDAA